MELIDRAALRDKAAYMYGFGENKYVSLAAIERQPTIEVAPVVHGRWIPVDGGQHKCSRCHTVRKRM